MYTQGKFVSRASWRVEFPAQRPRLSFSTATGHYTQNPRQRSTSVMAIFSPVIRSRLQQTVLAKRFLSCPVCAGSINVNVLTIVVGALIAHQSQHLVLPTAQNFAIRMWLKAG